ncbi:MAG: DUF6522 family protein [Geminicoccaceae bacterium]
MRQRSSWIRLGNDEITIDSELLAPKLGLSVDALRTEMRRGLVVSTAETGIDDDEGRARLTFRYRARTWRVVVESDGAFADASLPDSRARIPSLVDLVRRAS